jgi:hypothetical protein
MLAYGDDYFATPLRALLDGYARRLSVSPTTLEEARLLLVFAGQLEQAAEDAKLHCATACRHLTAAAAEAFLEALGGRTDPGAAASNLTTALSALRAACVSEAHLHLSMKTPEGFAWYALYPDAYVQAARQWMQQHSASRVAVIGIRSIGTTLAAVVAAALRRGGRHIAVATVRPTGHPFDRRTQLAGESCSGADHAIVVDEGPGLSGSSMASVARALSEQGFARHSITFFPGHQHGPGPQSSAEVRRCWASVQQFAVPWRDIQIGTCRAVERLCQSAAKVLNEPPWGELVDLSAGKWRAHGADRPTLGIAQLFEQPKYLLHAATDNAILLKFGGFTLAGITPDGMPLSAAEHQLDRLHALADAGFTPRPGGCIDGWLLLPWVTGRQLTAHDTDKVIPHRAAAYIARAAEPPMGPHEATEASKRLRSILLVNGEHLLGQTAAARLARLSDLIASEVQRLEIGSYGDGRLAPHEWIDTGDEILKVDAAGHVRDHTAVGRQSLLWDVAGAAVEWQLEHETACDLAFAVGASRTPRVVIAYYCAAYAAFRAGLAHMCAGASSSAVDRDDLLKARAIYSSRLRTEVARVDAFLPERAYIG